jgi:hypothetical protein
MPSRPPFEHDRQVGVRQAVAQGQHGVEMVGVVGGTGLNGDHEIGTRLLRADVRVGVRLGAIELLEHLLLAVAALGAVALDLPLAPQLRRRREVHAHVELRAELRRVVAEPPLDDDESPSARRTRATEPAVAVTVDRLEDCLAAAQVAEVLADDVDVVAVGISGVIPSCARSRGGSGDSRRSRCG